jgi:hypothetical protein
VDAIAPPSDNVERALNLELYDRAINNPNTNQEALLTDVLLGSYPKTKNDVAKYVKKQGSTEEQLAALEQGSPPSGFDTNRKIANKEIF